MSLHSPTIDSFELARTGRQLDGWIDVASLPRLPALLADPSGALHYRVTGIPGGEGEAGAELKVNGLLRLTCQRCNEPLEFDLDRTVIFRFMVSEEAMNALPIDEDEVDAVVGSRTMNVRDWIEDEAMLSLPLVPRHDKCSAVTNLRPEVDQVKVANPFSALAALRSTADGNKSQS